VPIKNNPLEKMLNFRHGTMHLNQTLYVSIYATYPVNFIEITFMVCQIQWFKR